MWSDSLAPSAKNERRNWRRGGFDTIFWFCNVGTEIGRKTPMWDQKYMAGKRGEGKSDDTRELSEDEEEDKGRETGRRRKTGIP